MFIPYNIRENFLRVLVTNPNTKQILTQIKPSPVQKRNYQKAMLIFIYSYQGTCYATCVYRVKFQYYLWIIDIQEFVSDKFIITCDLSMSQTRSFWNHLEIGSSNRTKPISLDNEIYPLFEIKFFGCFNFQTKCKLSLFLVHNGKRNSLPYV